MHIDSKTFCIDGYLYSFADTSYAFLLGGVLWFLK